jgi:pimeloyl-ACP methyl ester carboxylesterase
MDALDIGKANVVGDHTGAAIAVEAAVGHPARLDKLVLSGCPHYTPEERNAKRTDPRYATRLEIKEDGSHLLKIWGIPKSLAPHSKPESWHRVLVDYLVAGVHAIDAWHAVFRYDIEPRLPLIECPTLLISGSEDVFLHRLEASAGLIPRCRTKVIEGGGDVIAYERSGAFAEAIVEFISNPES